MEQLLHRITDSPLYLTIAIILAVALALSIIKRVIKLVLLALLVIVIYLSWLAWTGQKIPSSSRETVEHINTRIEQGKEIIQKSLPGGAAMPGR